MQDAGRLRRRRPDLYYVSSRTGLVLERHRGDDVWRFSDFRSVDGEVVPFRTVAQDALGQATTTIDAIRFAPAAPSGASFGPGGAGTPCRPGAAQ